MGCGRYSGRAKRFGFDDVLIQSAVLTDWPSGSVNPATVAPVPRYAIARKFRRETGMLVPLVGPPAPLRRLTTSMVGVAWEFLECPVRKRLVVPSHLPRSIP